jgi:integrase
MILQFHHLHSRYIYRQGARFYFRRRIPGLSPKTTPVVIPLGTTDQRSASILLGRLVVEFNRMISSLNMFAPALPEELVLKYITTSLRQVLPEFHSAVRIERMTGRGLQDGAWYREIHKLAVLILLEDGVNQTFPPHRIDPAWAPRQLETVLNIYKLEYDRVMSPEGRQGIARNFTDATGAALSSREHHAQVREAVLKVRLAAFHDVTRQPKQDFLSEADTLLKAVSETKVPNVADANLPHEDIQAAVISQVRDKVASPGACSVKLIEHELTIGALMEQFTIAQTAVAEGSGAYTRDIAGIFWRLAKQDALSDAVARQRAADLRLFCFVTGVQTIDEVEQWHLRRYTDALKEIPKNFLRSEYDQRRSYGQVKAMAANMPRDKVGLADGTTKRHLKSLELLLARAISEGHTIRFTSDVKGLRPKTKGRVLNHKKRAVFRLNEARTVFSHTLWQGHKSKGRRHDPGDMIVKDSRYWVPLILAYTGARRAEIAGLLPSDITVIDSIPTIIIQSNQWRGLKNEESGTTDPLKKLTRYVPFHSHLQELGLMQHAEKMRAKGETFLFPDVIPTPRKGSSRSLSPDPAAGVEKFGESIDDTWRKALKVALQGNPRELCMHSLRHFVNDTLLHNRDVLDVTRFDITGHAYRQGDQGSQKRAFSEINEQTYRDDVPLKIKAAAIEQLPRLF